jgi:hypothetical protein
VTSDAASNLLADIADGLNLGWTARNQLGSASSQGYPSTSYAESYDAAGRRETSTVTPLLGQATDILNFLHDGSSVAGWLDSVTGNSWSFLTAGGTTLAGSYTASGTTTTWVPLIDASGSTIALVNPASPGSPPAATFTYDPSGKPTVSGQANSFPFRYQGMEQEITDFPSYTGVYYSGNGQFYSGTISRSPAGTGAQGTGGAGGAGAGPGASSRPRRRWGRTR